MKFGVVVFPGTWSDRDCGWAVERVLDAELEYLWHRDRDLRGCDCVIIPGGFSYGDHLRAGAIARFAPVMDSVLEFAAQGGLVWGICNGFQVLCESGLLPGVLMRNDSLQFRCQWTHLVTERADLPFTAAAASRQVLRIPISHHEGSYFADPATLSRLEQGGQVVFRYSRPDGMVTLDANPNGSERNIAGIVSEGGNVLGLMPHPERACSQLLGSNDCVRLLESVLARVAV